MQSMASGTILSGVTPISEGGTGANNVWDARDNLYIIRNSQSIKTYTFNCPRKAVGDYSYFLMVGGAGTGTRFVYFGFLDTQANGDGVTLTPLTLTGMTPPILSGSYSGTTLTITYDGSNLWGGIRLIWLS